MTSNAAATATILCVDEAETGLYFRRLILEKHGYRVLTAGSAQRALEIFLKNDVDLVISDLQLGRDAGETLAAEVKRMRPNVPVLLLTGAGEPHVEAAGDRIDKTASPVEFLGCVHKLLESKPRVSQDSLQPDPSGKSALPADAELDTVRSLLADIVESSDDAILSKTLDGTITSWNRAAEKMYGYAGHEIVGKNATLLVPPDLPNEEHEILLKMQRGEKVDHFETRRIAKDGRILHVSVTISPLRDRNGKVIGASTITRDITHQKFAERALRDSEKLAVAGRMAATVAHEINNPLEALSNIFYLLKQDKNVSEMSRQFIQTGEDELKRVTQITRLTLGFHRDRYALETSVSISDLIENVLALYSRKIQALGVKVDKQYETLGTIRGNSGELRQVFSNLVVNAIDALSSRGDRLILRVKEGMNGKGVHGVSVVIADNGPGIAKESLSRLFEPFFTTKGDKGTGIGLWVSRGIIAKHKGTIHVKSRTTRGRPGTVFSVFIPKAIANEKDASDDKAQHSLPRAS
jgi:PAS domain S-box-containing protein